MREPVTLRMSLPGPSSALERAEALVGLGRVLAERISRHDPDAADRIAAIVEGAAL